MLNGYINERWHSLRDLREVKSFSEIRSDLISVGGAWIRSAKRGGNIEGTSNGAANIASLKLGV